MKNLRKITVFLLMAVMLTGMLTCGVHIIS